MALPEPEPDVPIGAPSASKADRFPDDRFLRAMGWVIHARPRKGPALWKKGNDILPVKEAIKEAKRGRNP